jgi:ribosome maturation protein SDO1|tara:strand:- start:21137 stop:21835 length:699 start_codon:yes stop_codon:yes gene_type:complete
MVDVDKAVIARYKKGDLEFEILVDCDKAMEYKQGQWDINDVIATNDIFKDVKKGQHASEQDLENVFKTEDKNKIIEIIIKEGEVQLTADYKNKLREVKKKAIINLIHRNAINPQNNLPHPPDRIERAIEEAKIKIDEFKKAEEQVQDVVSQITKILPIKFEVWEIAVKLPAEIAGKSYSVLKEFGELKKDEWQNDGSLIAKLEVPAGLFEEFENSINKLSHGNIEIKILEKR